MTLNDRRFFALGLLLAQESHAIDPMDANAGNTLGLALYRNGRHAEAVKVLEHNLTLRHGTSDPFDLFVLAMARHQLGDTDAAVADFNRANRRVARLSRQLNEFALVRFEAESLLFATGNK